MKKKIHPKYYKNIQVTCACGNTFTTGSTLEKIQVEICSACHPFFTGKMKFVDSLGRVERFRQKTKQAQTQKKTQSKKDKKKKQERPTTLKEMLQKKKQK